MTTPFLALLAALALAENGAPVIQNLAVTPAELSQRVEPRSLRLRLSPQQPPHVKTQPAEAPTNWGAFSFGPQDDQRLITIALREQGENVPQIWIDANGDGDLVNDPPVACEASNGADGRPQVFSGTFTLAVPWLKGQLLRVFFHRFAPAEARRRRLPVNQLFCIADYGVTGQVQADGQAYDLALLDFAVSGDFSYPRADGADGLTVYLDKNRNRQFEPQTERFAAGDTLSVGKRAFTIRSISTDGTDVVIAPASARDPTLRVASAAPGSPGSPALPFEAKLLDGRAVKFPADYKGKLVLLEFWATWCGPCRAELPYMRETYKKHHAAGFDILGVSIDKPNQTAAVRRFIEGEKLPWPQVHPPLEIGGQWNVSSIPRMFLVDGDSGMVIASGNQLRVGRLEGVVAEALKIKQRMRAGGGEGDGDERGGVDGNNPGGSHGSPPSAAPSDDPPAPEESANPERSPESNPPAPDRPAPRAPPGKTNEPPR